MADSFHGAKISLDFGEVKAQVSFLILSTPRCQREIGIEIHGAPGRYLSAGSVGVGGSYQNMTKGLLLGGYQIGPRTFFIN